MNLSALEKIDQLRQKGVLSDAEFQAEKAKILNQGQTGSSTNLRPKGPKVIGVLNIIFGVSGLLGIPLAFLHEHMFTAHIINATQAIIMGGAFYLPALVSGVSFVQYKSFGRKWVLVGSVLAIISGLLLWSAWVINFSKGNFNSYEATLVTGGAFGGWLMIVYPTIVLILCSKKKFREALS
jgi:hypothetical protein